MKISCGALPVSPSKVVVATVFQSEITDADSGGGEASAGPASAGIRATTAAAPATPRTAIMTNSSLLLRFPGPTLLRRDRERVGRTGVSAGRSRTHRTVDHPDE